MRSSTTPTGSGPTTRKPPRGPGDGVAALPPAGEQAILDVIPVLGRDGLRGLPLERVCIDFARPDRCAAALRDCVHRSGVVTMGVGDEDGVEALGELTSDPAVR